MNLDIPRNWCVTNSDKSSAQKLARALDLHPLTASILVARGCTRPSVAHKYLHPTYEDLPNPELLRDLKRAVHRTLEAFRDRDHIRVVGDYDVDGVTATSTVYQFIRDLGVQVDYRILQRGASGYGLRRELVDEAHRDGVKLIITCDCGTSNLEEIRYAGSLGIDTIVIDHHALPPELPPAAAILNPLLPGCKYPFKHLAAVGVAFTFVRGVFRALKRRDVFTEATAPRLEDYLDIVALGTVADVVPLHDDNRVLARLGLKVLSRRRRAGVSALIDRAQLDGQPITARTIGYRLAPLLNAAGRVGDATRCVELLTTDTYGEADRLARVLEKNNTERQRQERAILEEAMALAKQEYNEGHALLMLAGEQWYQGVLGIVASRVKVHFHRPAALVAIDIEKALARVSLRSVEGVDLIAALSEVSELLESHGGHTAAAGMTLKLEHLPHVRKTLEAAIQRQHPELPRPNLTVDATCRLAQLDDRFTAELELLGPFGAGNPEPSLLARDLRPMRTRVLGGRHLRTQLRDGDATYDAIGFALAPLLRLFDKNVTVIFTPRRRVHRGRLSLELLIRDARNKFKLTKENRRPCVAE